MGLLHKRLIVKRERKRGRPHKILIVKRERENERTVSEFHNTLKLFRVNF